MKIFFSFFAILSIPIKAIACNPQDDYKNQLEEKTKTLYTAVFSSSILFSPSETILEPLEKDQSATTVQQDTITSDPNSFKYVDYNRQVRSSTPLLLNRGNSSREVFFSNPLVPYYFQYQKEKHESPSYEEMHAFNKKRSGGSVILATNYRFTEDEKNQVNDTNPN
jgi:hypothetical protein